MIDSPGKERFQGFMAMLEKEACRSECSTRSSRYACINNLALLFFVLFFFARQNGHAALSSALSLRTAAELSRTVHFVLHGPRGIAYKRKITANGKVRRRPRHPTSLVLSRDQTSRTTSPQSLTARGGSSSRAPIYSLTNPARRL